MSCTLCDIGFDYLMCPFDILWAACYFENRITAQIGRLNDCRTRLLYLLDRIAVAANNETNKACWNVELDGYLALWQLIGGRWMFLSIFCQVGLLRTIANGSKVLSSYHNLKLGSENVVSSASDDENWLIIAQWCLDELKKRQSKLKQTLRRL